MPFTFRRCVLVVVAAAVCAGCVVMVSGCARETTPPATQRTPDVTYTTRAKVIRLPRSDDKVRELIVMHEPIDTFVDPTTGQLGMNSMEMPFALAKDVSIAGVAVDDPVEIVFSVWYKPHPTLEGKKMIEAWQATKVTKLPADTKLTFGRASPPLGGGVSTPSGKP